MLKAKIKKNENNETTTKSNMFAGIKAKAAFPPVLNELGSHVVEITDFAMREDIEVVKRQDGSSIVKQPGVRFEVKRDDGQTFSLLFYRSKSIADEIIKNSLFEEAKETALQIIASAYGIDASEGMDDETYEDLQAGGIVGKKCVIHITEKRKKDGTISRYHKISATPLA